MNTRAKGTIGERIALTWYEHKGRTCIAQNFTIRGGELDLVMEKGGARAYVEVKMIDGIIDLHGFVTPRKLGRVRKTLAHHLQKFPTTKEIQLDVVFVQGGEVVEVFDHVSS